MAEQGSLLSHVMEVLAAASGNQGRAERRIRPALVCQFHSFMALRFPVGSVRP